MASSTRRQRVLSKAYPLFILLGYITATAASGYSATANAYAIRAPHCSANLSIQNGSYVTDNFSTTVGSEIHIICDVGYRIYNSTTNSTTRTCVIDETGTSASWCWALPCEEILCPMPEDPGNATLLDRTGLSINDTILYQCPYGYQVTETGLIYYTITCNLLPDGLSANWSPIPEIEPLNCSDIYPDTKAISQLSDVSIGAVMHVVCDPGYRVFGLKTDNFNTTCELDKTGTDADWCWIPPCEEIICPEPDVVAMATYVMNGNELGDNVTYTCETNYKISNTSTNVTDAICGYDEDFQGVWIGVPTCEEIICPDLPTLSNAFIEALPTNTRIGDATVYQCVDNCSAYLDGVQLRFTKTFNVTCRVDDDHFTAVWIANYTCDVSQCDEPGALPYCLLTIGNMTLDSVVNYDCVDNFVFNSTGKKRMSSRCVLDRGEIIPHWTAVDYCEPVLCPEAPNIPNANLISSSRNVGAIAEYDCDLGFSVTGESLTTTKFRITCLLKADQISANWTVAPTCESMSCSEPPVISNGKVKVGGYHMGEEAVYTCDPEYQITSDISIPGLSTSEKSVCVLDEEQGCTWKPIYKCISQETNEEIKPIVRQCPTPKEVEGTKLHYKNLYIHSKVTYTTFSGYTFEFGGRTRSLFCQSNGYWSMKTVKTKYNLCPPFEVRGATKSTERNIPGTEVTIRCDNPKAKLENGLSTVRVKCTDLGKWTYIPESCNVNRCGPFDVVERSQLIAFNNTVGGLAVIRCNKATSFPRGDVTGSYRCLSNLTWEQHGHCLVNTCPTLPESRHGILSTGIVLEGTVVDVKCLPGYMFPDGSRVKHVICDTSLQWNVTLDDCQILICPTPPTTDHCNTTKLETIYNSNITYRCQIPYRMEYGYTEVTIRCEEDGLWTYSTITCDLDRCPPIPEVRNANPDTRLATNGTTVTYTCNYGYMFPNGNIYMYVYCDGVTWNVTETTCIKVKCPELNLKNAEWSQDGDHFGDEVRFTCDEGHHYKNTVSGVLKCEADSEWSENTTGCQPVECGSVPELKYSIRNIPRDTLYGSIVSYRCLSNYWIEPGVTNTSVFCTKFGRWSDITGYCRIITCPAVPVWDDVDVNTTDNTVGTTVNVSCSTEEDESRLYVISHCTSTAEWIPPLGGCKVKKTVIFEPEPEEAKSSKSIGVFIMICMTIVYAPLVISDVPAIIRALKGE